MKTTQTVKILFRNLTSIEASKETKWLCCGMHSSWGDILSLLWTCKCDKSWLREYVHWIISYLSSGVSLVWLFLCFPLFQRLEGQDILSFVGSKPRPNEEDICFVIRPLLDVVNYLHGQQIVHLDIRVCEVKLDCKWVLYFICFIFFISLFEYGSIYLLVLYFPLGTEIGFYSQLVCVITLLVSFYSLQTFSSPKVTWVWNWSILVVHAASRTGRKETCWPLLVMLHLQVSCTNQNPLL